MPDPQLAPEIQAAAAAAADSNRMSIFAHLSELRRRLIYSVVCVVILTCVCFEFAPNIFEFLRQPMESLPDNPKMIVTDPMEMFATYIKLALLSSACLSSPFVLIQLWLFVSPGLYANEKKWVVPFTFFGTTFFLSGAAFCFYVVLPGTLKYLYSLGNTDSVITHYSVSVYFALITNLMLAFGAVFELPLVMALLGASGVIKSESMSKFRRYWIIIAAIIGGVLTPTPDPMTQMMMAIPLMLFFELGILGARLLERRRPPAAQEQI
jgi:sec-independent protein translocase protein TatC